MAGLSPYDAFGIKNGNYVRENGIYYTPARLAIVLAEWGIRSPADTVLDPSYGGCAMLEAARQVLERLGAAEPGRMLYGVDLDPGASRYAIELVDRGATPAHFIEQDFLALNRTDLPSVRFVLANPPYVRHHRITEEAQAQARKVLMESDHILSKRASYWAYFVFRAMDFLLPDGRMAFVLPGAFLHADYSSTIKTALTENFRSVTAIRIGERLFDDADEETVILLCDGKGGTTDHVLVSDVSNVTQLREAVNPRYDGHTRLDRTEMAWHLGLVRRQVIDLLGEVRGQAHGFALQDLATVRIGAVTGANKFFIVDRKTLATWGIPESMTTPILTHASQLGSGLSIDPATLQKLVQKGGRLFLLTPPVDGPLPEGLLSYLRDGEQKKLHTRYKCSVRSPWYRVTDRVSPDAFFTYMSWSGPRIILNQTTVDATNTIHRLTFTQVGREVGARNVALGMLSSAAQLSAEITGRTYGGGVLKLEPGEAQRVWIPMLEADQNTFEHVNSLVGTGQISAATDLVDRAVQLQTGITDLQMETLRQELARIRERRMSCGKRTRIE